jgi:hypothetical protein
MIPRWLLGPPTDVSACAQLFLYFLALSPPHLAPMLSFPRKRYKFNFASVLTFIVASRLVYHRHLYNEPASNNVEDDGQTLEGDLDDDCK